MERSGAEAAQTAEDGVEADEVSRRQNAGEALLVDVSAVGVTADGCVDQEAEVAASLKSLRAVHVVGGRSLSDEVLPTQFAVNAVAAELAQIIVAEGR